MEIVKTFVFFDLETTGLPNCSPTKVTEISLVAAERDQILEKHDGVTKENNLGECYLPRVLNKINFTLYPCKMVHPAAAAVSGLSNENLLHQKPFDDNLFGILQLFLDRLEKPVCLVAHNGNKFDFPILKSELIKIGKDLPEEVFCVDSLPGFRDILTTEPKCDDVSNGIRPLDVPANGAVDLMPKCGFSQEDYDLEMIRTLEVSERIIQEHDNFNAKEIEIRVRSEMEKLRKANETTPVRKPKHTASRPMTDHARRKILTDQRKPKPKFTLGAVYERVVRKQLVHAHRAESDSLALLECVTAIGLPIMEWMDTNKVPFRNIKRMW